MREKNPTNIEEACDLSERYTALISDDSGRRTNVRHVKPADAPESTDPAVSQQQLSEAIAQVTEQMGRQFQQLAKLIKAPSTEVRPPPAAPAFAAPASAPAYAPPSHQQQQQSSTVPRKPCPRCGQQGHWARDCRHSNPPPASDGCFPLRPERTSSPRVQHSPRNRTPRNAFKPLRADASARYRARQSSLNPQAHPTATANPSAAYTQARVDGMVRRCLQPTR